MDKNTIEKIEECKQHITCLSKIQDKLFSDLENLLECDDDIMNDYVFDYVYNSNKSSFQKYLSVFGKNANNEF